jgi:hypothetical protein
MNFLLIAVAFVAAQGGFIYGFDSGMPASSSPLTPSWCWNNS